jgi:hypothetical protein
LRCNTVRNGGVPSRFVDKYNSRYKIYQPANRHGKVCTEAVRHVQHSKAWDGWMKYRDDPSLLPGFACGRIVDHRHSENRNVLAALQRKS